MGLIEASMVGESMRRERNNVERLQIWPLLLEMIL